MDEPAATRVRFRRTGGLFAGNVLETSLDEQQLASPEAAELHRLIAAVDLAELAARSPIRARGADRYQYELEVDHGGERRHVIVSDGAIPDDLRALVTLLERRANEEGRRKP